MVADGRMDGQSVNRRIVDNQRDVPTIISASLRALGAAFSPAIFPLIALLSAKRHSDRNPRHLYEMLYDHTYHGTLKV